MTRAWLSFRLLRPAGMNHDDHTARAISDVVPALVRHLRSADADGRWQFRHTGERDCDLEISFHSTPAVIEELEHRLRLQSSKHDWPVSLVPALRRPGPRDGAAESSLAAQLSAASSDFALELLADGGLAPDDHLNAAALNLRFLSGLLPAADRASFLFHGWQHWSRSLTPAQRIELGEQAAKEAEHIMRTTEQSVTQAHWLDPWQRYFRALESILDSQSSAAGTPINYLLFEHAHLTHNRLGVPAGVEAVAARALRTALTAQPGEPPSLLLQVAPASQPA